MKGFLFLLFFFTASSSASVKWEGFLDTNYAHDFSNPPTRGGFIASGASVNFDQTIARDILLHGFVVTSLSILLR